MAALAFGYSPDDLSEAYGVHHLRKLFKSPRVSRAFVYYTDQITVRTIVQGTFEELP